MLKQIEKAKGESIFFLRLAHFFKISYNIKNA